MRRRTSFTQTVADAQRPLTQPQRYEQHTVEPALPLDPTMGETFSYVLRPIGTVLRCALFGLGLALVSEALLGWRANGPSVAAFCGGLALALHIVADSETVRAWADWVAELHFARELQSQQWERQRAAVGQSVRAAQVLDAVNSQPSADDELINRTVQDILLRYYEMRARDDPELGKRKLWSDRQIDANYQLGRHSNATKRIHEVLESIADGYHLSPGSYRQAFRALFGVEPGEWQDNTLVRMGDNPARGEPVLVPQKWM